MKNNKGFTLIELLVVIAIIGILAAVILPSLNTARSKGSDAAIKAGFNSARTEAALYFNDNDGSYNGLCDTTPLANGTKSLNERIVSIQESWGTTTQAINIDLNTAGAGDIFSCHENGSAYAVEGPLKASTVGVPVMVCVDSTGASIQGSNTLAAGSVVCN